MKLTELDPHFIKHTIEMAGPGHGRTLPDGTMQWGGFEVDCMAYVDTLAEADGIWFDCPKCTRDKAAGLLKGVHGVRIFFAGKDVPDRIGLNSEGKAVRWSVSGTDFTNLSTSPSILLLGGCGWHGFITNGEVSII